MTNNAHSNVNNFNTAEFFFDYACPYCYETYKAIVGILQDFPDTQILWRPCEAHPRPSDHHRPHSDLCIQAMFFAADNSTDLQQYHTLVFSLIHGDRIDAEDITTLVQHLSPILDTNTLRQALSGGVYAQVLRDANRYAFEESDVWAIPAFRANGQKLDAVIDIGITKEQLQDFLNKNR